jgi:hypothetical protein
MNTTWTSLITTTVTVLFGGGLIVALLTLRPQRAKLSAEATSVLTCASASWVARVQEHAEKAMERAEEAENEAHQLRLQVTDLQRRLDLAEHRMSRVLRVIRAMDIDLPESIFGPPTEEGKVPPVQA